MTFKIKELDSNIVLAIFYLFLMLTPAEFTGTEGIVNFETVNNYMGAAVIFYGQEIAANSINTTSYEVTDMMACRRIKNATDFPANPLNIVSIGSNENGSITCRVAYQHIYVLKLLPKVGMITYLTRNSNMFHPAQSGIFYTLPDGSPYDYSYKADRHCIGNWELANAITPTLKNELASFMKVKAIVDINVAASCLSTGPKWFDGTPFNYSFILGSVGVCVTYHNDGIGNEWFACSSAWVYNIVVCMANVYPVPWNQF